MSFQWIVDNAESVQINKRGVVAQTVARDQTVRSLSRGGIIWRFTVTPASGLRYNDAGVRSYIETIDNIDRISPAYINFSRYKLFAYQGTGAPTSMTVTQGSSSATISGGSGAFRFLSGDVVQLSTRNPVYSIYGNVTGTSVTLHRPVIDPSGTYALNIGNNVQFYVICTQIPDYKILPGGLVQWTGDFTFVESLI